MPLSKLDFVSKTYCFKIVQIPGSLVHVNITENAYIIHFALFGVKKKPIVITYDTKLQKNLNCYEMQTDCTIFSKEKNKFKILYNTKFIKKAC